MTKLESPKSAADITLKWMRQMLASNKEFRSQSIKDIEVEQLGDGAGHTSCIYRCKLNLADSTEVSVIVKAPATDPQTLQFAKGFNLYSRERSFYLQADPNAPIQVPKLIASFENSHTDVVLILEDLKDFEVYNQIQGASDMQAMSAIRAIALLQAYYLEKLEQDHLVLAGSGHSNTVVQFFIFQRFIKCARRFRHLVPLQLLNYVELVTRRYDQFIEQSQCGFNTLVHGDYRLENLFYAPKGNELSYVIDWQGASIGCGLRDVAYFLATSVTPNVRLKVEREAVKEYHQILCESGKLKDFSFEQCWHSYRQNYLYVLIYFVVIAGGLPVNKESQLEQLLEVIVHRIDHVIADLEIFELIPEPPKVFSVANLVSNINWSIYKIQKALF